MSDVSARERAVQNRVVRLFREGLGYEYLGNWTSRGNANVEIHELERNLRGRGYAQNLITTAMERLRSAISLGGGQRLYEANREVYGLLRYGIKVKSGAGEPTQTVWLIDWDNPESNDFALAEEVTVAGHVTKRPDLVLYINGIALVTIELKRSIVDVAEGIRQTIVNQQPEFIQQFFTTVQLVLAGNESQGVRYGVIDTPEDYWLRWKEPSDLENLLDRELTQLCTRQRLLELVHDFMVFDAGVKKICRHNQFFGVKAAQGRIGRREGGIIWHTQGSGKSLTMVWLAKWIREHQPDARVLIVTDRTELDDQIKQVFEGADEKIYRTRSGMDLIARLNTGDRWLICSLIQKFRSSEEESERDKAGSEFIKELNRSVPKGFRPKGNFFVFVDEAHRTQSGALHDAMKALLPGAILIGFTGTPLLKSDKYTTIQRFGDFIHSYTYGEAAKDGVVLDLRYEARDIDQELSSPEQVDRWFEAKTRNLTESARAELKRRWGTLKKIYSSADRSRKIVTSILMDMETRPRLMNRRGNAILVCSSIYQACTFYDLFCQAGFEGKCAIITSYVPQPSDIAQEGSGHGWTEKHHKYRVYRRMLADHFAEPEDQAMKKIERFEREVKERFVKEPGQMRLLIVVDKLLTGFDAPSATYLYIDKNMHNQGLFQAICRVNRLDGEDKQYGYIVDYRDLFNSLRAAIRDYTGGALNGYDREDVEGLLTDRITQARIDLDTTLERVRAICEPVEPPRDVAQYQRYFCGHNTDDIDQLDASEPQRIAFYHAVAAVTRAYSNLAADIVAAGYTEAEAASIKSEIEHYANARTVVRLAARENVDFKRYEADMRQLLDTYVSAKPAETVSEFSEVGLLELVDMLGTEATDRLPGDLGRDPEAVGEMIVNNVRRVIVDEHLMNPVFYDRMSRLLEAILEDRRQGAMDYQAYLARLRDLAARLEAGGLHSEYPAWADTPGRRALFDLLDQSETLASTVDRTIQEHKRDAWVGNEIKERKLKRTLADVLPADFDRLDELLNLMKAHREYH